MSFIIAAKVLGAVGGSRFPVMARAKELLVSLGQRLSAPSKTVEQASSSEVFAADEEAPGPSASAPSPRPGSPFSTLERHAAGGISVEGDNATPPPPQKASMDCADEPDTPEESEAEAVAEVAAQRL